MKSVSGGGPKATLSLAQAKDVPEAVPLHEPPSPPLTPEDRVSVQADLDQQRELLARHSDTEPLTGMVDGWSKRYWSYAHEIARLERMLKYG